MNEKIVVNQVVKYGGHSLSANGSVNLTLKAAYSELVGTIKMTQMLNNDVIVKARVPNLKPMKLGMFRLKSINIDDDGESTIKLNGLNDYIEMDNLNTLPIKGEDVELFSVRYEVIIEEDEDGGED